MKKPHANQHGITSMPLLALCVAFTLCFNACRKTELQNVKPDVKSFAGLMAALPSTGQIKVMSFNMRNTAEGDPFTQDERKSYLLKIVLDNDVDILGVQELADNAIEAWFNTEMAAAGYGYYSTPAHNGSPKTIYYKNARFNRSNAGSFTMRTPDYRSGKWVILQDRLDPPSSYFVVNSHWTTVSSTERSMGADTVINAILTNNTDNLPVICMGDFNALPGTPEITKLKNAFSMVDALFEGQGDPTFHRWEATGVSKIDYIMSTRDLAFTSSKVITTSFTVNGQTLWPSDHFPVMASYLPAAFGGAHNDANGKSASANTSYYFADVNGDGWNDKIYWNRGYDSGRPQVFLSKGDGTFVTPAVVHQQSASTLATTRYHFADVSGDGKADLIQWDPTLNSGHTRVFLALQNGYFGGFIDNPEGTSQGTTTVYTFADVNADGKADKIYWNAGYDNGHSRVYLATGSGKFSGSVVSSADGASTTAGTRYWYEDVNGDFKKDKIVWHPSLNSGKTMVYLSDGDGTFTASASFSNSGATSASSATDFYFADVNGDHRADKIYWNPGNYLGEPKIYYSGSANTFDGPLYSLRGTSQSANTQFYFSDINGDGRADQIRWNYGENSGELRNYFAR